MESPSTRPAGQPPLDPRNITRPEPVLRTHYIITAVLSGPGIVIAMPLLLFKYMTLHYRFDDEGIAMSWGVLFRREVYLTYRRIQDIHVTRGIIQRWLGIATIAVQTASGSSSAEMEIEGITRYEELRDYLYRRMRGAHGEPSEVAAPSGSGVAKAAAAGGAVPGASGTPDEALALLREIRDELRRIKQGAGGGGS